MKDPFDPGRPPGAEGEPDGDTPGGARGDAGAGRPSDAGDAGGGGFLLPDLGGLLEGMQRVQEARAGLYQGHAGGGAVRIEATGSLEFTGVAIEADVVATGDGDLIQDLVLAALHDLTARIAAAQHDAMGDAMGDLGALGLSGLGGLADVGGLGGLPSAGDSPPADDDDPAGP